MRVHHEIDRLGLKLLDLANPTDATDELPIRREIVGVEIKQRVKHARERSQGAPQDDRFKIIR